MPIEIEIIKFLQSFSNPFLDGFFELITILGEQILFVVIISYFYWIKNKQLGEYLSFSLLGSLSLNNILKDILKFSRPIGIEGITSNRVETATGYSFPSGHTQGVSTFTYSLSIWFRKWWMFLLSTLFVVLVGISRLYLGVHYPKDVLAGLLFGFILSALFYFLFVKIKNKPVLYAIVAVIMLPYIFFAESDDVFKSYGLYLGFALGMFVEKKFVQFNCNVPTKKKVIRYISGLVFVGAVLLIMELLTPDVSYGYVIKYGILAFAAFGLYPLLIKKLRI